MKKIPLTYRFNKKIGEVKLLKAAKKILEKGSYDIEPRIILRKGRDGKLVPELLEISLIPRRKKE